MTARIFVSFYPFVIPCCLLYVQSFYFQTFSYVEVHVTFIGRLLTWKYISYMWDKGSPFPARVFYG